MNMIIKIWHYDNIKNYIKRSTLCESIVRVGLLLVKEMYIKLARATSLNFYTLFFHSILILSYFFKKLPPTNNFK